MGKEHVVEPSLHVPVVVTATSVGRHPTMEQKTSAYALMPTSVYKDATVSSETLL